MSQMEVKIEEYQVKAIVESKNKIQIEIDDVHDEEYLTEKGKITFNKEEASDPSKFVLGATISIDEKENLRRVAVEGELPDVKITIYKKVIERVGDTKDIKQDLGATATHESVHATDKGSNINVLPRKLNIDDYETKPDQKELEYYQEINQKKGNKSITE